jgi:hypothetical protein
MSYYSSDQYRYDRDNFKYNFNCNYTCKDKLPLKLSNIAIDDIYNGDKYFVISSQCSDYGESTNKLVYSHGNECKYYHDNDWRLGDRKQLIEIYFSEYKEVNKTFGLYLYDQFKNSKKFIEWSKIY